MARKIAWTESAWNDLEDAAEYIRRDSVHYAAAFVREVRDAARSLAYLSERGRIVPEFDDPSIREFFVRSYRLIYHLKGRFVFIVAFIHGARDLLALWEREGRMSPENIG